MGTRVSLSDRCVTEEGQEAERKIWLEVETNVFLYDSISNFLEIHDLRGTAYKVESFSA